MRLTNFAAVLLLLTPFSMWAQSNFIVPNTTLAQQTGNNSSAASSFANQSNGNLVANNVSKVDVHTLLNSGTATKVLAHLLLWFGQPGHIDVGYNSDSPTQIHNQVTDMISRGINGVVIDWYGPNNSIDQATQLVMQEAEQHPGFTFAIMIDAGAIGQNICPTCSPQQTLIQLLQYVEHKYFTSSSYFTIDNQPVILATHVPANRAADENVSGKVFLSRDAGCADGGGESVGEYLGHRSGILMGEHAGNGPRRRGVIGGKRTSSLPEISFPVTLHGTLASREQLNRGTHRQTIDHGFAT